MNTPSHLLMTAALRHALPRWDMSRSAVLLGSVAPDVPLYLLSAGGLWCFQVVEGMSGREAASHIFGTLYFQDPWWLSLHNLLHSPTSLLMLLVVCRLLPGRWSRFVNWTEWFLAACLFHSLVDIVTHHDDGPLLLWPLEWSVRYESPVSYWDHQFHGENFFIFEVVFDLLLAMMLIGIWLRRRKQGSAAKSPLSGENGHNSV